MSATDIHWDRDADGIVTLTLDQAGQAVNTLGERFSRAVHDVVERLVAERDSIAGVIITSAKKTFVAGADLNEIRAYTAENVGVLAASLDAGKADFRALETLGVPVVAALNGAALGGGYELALACHHRILLDVKGAQVGLPEVKLGLLPGGGGVVRTVRMFGIQRALTTVLLQGPAFGPAEALHAGLVDDIAATPEDLIAKARAWIKANPDAKQPWDVKGYRIPGGTPASPGLAAQLPAFPATLRKQLGGQNLPAPRAILATAVESAQVDIDTATRIETRYLAELVADQVSKNMISAFFFDLQSINKGGSRPQGYPVTTFHKTAVLGAGMMGAGIAYVQAMAGMQVILKDLTLEAAEKGKGYSAALLDKAVARGRITSQRRDEVLARIHPCADFADLTDCDLVVEAVFEDPKIKKQVFADAEKAVRPDALLASNTSTLPITDLAAGVARPQDFIGLHFFSPVDKMPLVEIVVGAQTSDATLAKAIDYTVAIKKTPIVVNDKRGFFTSRVIGFFLDQALAMLGEGISPLSIERAAVAAGYPAPALQLYDELTLTLPLKITRSLRDAAAAEGGTFTTTATLEVLERMVEKLGRHGRSSGAGFYDYDANGTRIGLWQGIFDEFGSGRTEIPFEDMKDRMLVAPAIETAKCFDDGVLRTTADANIGSIFGIGFPAWTGGVVQYINQFPDGVAGFVARADELAHRYGAANFTVPQSVRDAAETGRAFP
ncbi:3-hydroxyacyl-CoA dehydrogenase NAD-binding domain-containing protein [Nocardia sp. NPDC050406]|uniref:3-hydroxyacyl-CoA dehydrogenase NAD-binding domain-containing protein n=1 Tax=Nocardia sp. NPDC050406 TaxID=3364318 RepID=UPI00379DA662